MNVQHRSMGKLALILLVLLSGCQPHDQAAEVQARTVEAQVLTVSLTAMPVFDATPGSVISEQQVQVASRLMGYIRDIQVHEGDTVKTGQLLFTIDPSDIQGQVVQARAGHAQAEAALGDAKTDFERFSNLYKEESVPKLQYDKMKLQYSIAQSQARAARAGLDMAESQLRYAEVRAPIAGVVTQKMASAGDLAAPGRPVLVLENPGRLMVQTSVSNETYPLLKLGDSALVEISGQARTLEGKIVRLVPAADALSHTHLVKLDLPDAKGLTSGAFARVRFNVGAGQGISVPKAAILQRAGITGVFVVDGQGIARYRMVRTGEDRDGAVEIAAGLNPGEKVVVGNADKLSSGDRVQLTGSTTP
ncbi:MAG: efflux RND transporter periplasmic adaptor subunit [Gallionella sp.]|nr:efflux RND transporter periplasmic adaptor subunit [Gallionella sp.]